MGQLGNWRPLTKLPLVLQCRQGFRHVKNLIAVSIVVALTAVVTGCTASPVLEYALAISSTAGGSVVSPAEGISMYKEGTVLALVAEPEEGYQFVNWIGDVGTIADVNAATTTITMNGHYFITASFEQDEQVDNTRPMADAGSDQTVVVLQTVQLDGSGSDDADGDPLIYMWSIAAAPIGSTATLSDSTIIDPTFTPDLAGPYTIQLVVNDGMEDSHADSVTVIAETPGLRNSLNVFACSFRPGSIVKLASGQSYWIRMSIGFEGPSGYDDAVADHGNISFSVTLNGDELDLYGSTEIEYNSGAGFWEINGYYHTGVLGNTTYQIIGISYRSGEYVDSATFYIVVD